jgi:protease stability complex PrcB-like protein
LERAVDFCVEMTFRSVASEKPCARGGASALVVIVAIAATGPAIYAMQPALPRTIAKGDQSNIESPAQVLARTEAEWEALWRRHAGDRERPPVDFTREIVVGVFMGSRPNAGFSTTITTSMEVKGVLIVRYTETIPPPGAVTAQILTFPYHLVAIPKAAITDVRFEKVP